MAKVKVFELYDGEQSWLTDSVHDFIHVLQQYADAGTDVTVRTLEVKQKHWDKMKPVTLNE
jgi:hypothetical protein